MRGRAFIAVVLIFAFLSLAQAQEATPPVEPSTATPPPAEVPTQPPPPTPEPPTLTPLPSETPTDFALWKTFCSMRPNGARTRIQAYIDGLSDTRCQIVFQQLLGEAQLIGFTTGTHLHYQVALDTSDPDSSGDIFNRPYGNPSQPGEWIDPVVNYDLHMPPGRGGRD